MTRIGPAAVACLLLAPSVYVPASGQSATRTVLFALQRSERLHAFDAETLEHLGYFRTGPLGDDLGARADGRVLFLLQPSRDDVNSCCSLRALDLATREMCWLSDFAAGQIVVSSGMVTVNGNAFNTGTLERMTLPRPGVTAFAAKPSADGRHTARVDRGPVLVFITVATGVQRSIPIPEDARTGDWFGNRYALISAGVEKGRIWLVGPDDAELPAPRGVVWPDRHPRLHRVFAAGSNLIAHARFGRSLKQDPREVDPQIPGGALVIPSAGGTARRIARDMYFTALVPGVDGRSLYGLEAGPREGGPVPVRLVQLDVRTGAMTRTVVIRDPKVFPYASFDVWSLAIANVPVDVVPRGEVQVVATATCAGRSTSSPIR